MTKPNVLLVVMDGVRAKSTSLHGYENETTPFLERFAASATKYTQARAPGIWSLPSHASIFTGLHVVEHGVVDLGDGLKPGATVWERLADRHGYATGVFSENTWLVDMDVGLKDAFETVEGARNFPYPEAEDPNLPYHRFAARTGFDRYAGMVRESLAAESPGKAFVNGLATKLAWDHPGLLPEDWAAADTPGEVFTDLFLSWSDGQSGPWAACVNYLDAHFPYEPPAEHDRWGGSRLRALQSEMDDQVWEFNGGQRPWWQRRALEGLYDGGIRYMDSEFERLVSALDARGELDDTLVVVTADHGEGFGEPSRIRPDMRIPAHLSGLHECQLHVPLVVKAPGQSEGRVVEDLATLTRFPAAVRACVDDSEPADREFRPEGPALASSHGLEKPMEERAGNYVDDTWRFNGDAMAVYEDAETGVRKSATWRDDYEVEVTAVTAADSYVSGEGGRERVEAVFDELEPRDVRDPSDGDVSRATAERLEQLGYM
ncbi:MAG: sulfatase [Haloarculaceae archaeon]